MPAASVKNTVKNISLKALNSLGVSSKYIGTPKSFAITEEWVAANKNKAGVFFKEIYPATSVKEAAPLSVENSIHSIYSNEYSRRRPQAFVACIPNGRVWGRNGTVITPDDILLSDVSREFGKYKGVFDKQHSVFRRFKLGGLQKIKGNVAIVATSGSSNYYHWMFDVMPRFALLQKSGVWDKIDHFIIDYTGQKFQKECLELLGIPLHKIIKSNDQWKFHMEAASLWVPSLPSVLSTVEQWSVDYLGRLFLNITPVTAKRSRKLYISRRKAPSRKLLNEDEIFEELKKSGFEEFFPENYSVKEAAVFFNEATHVVGVHGAGFSNIAFCEAGTRVLDIVAPRHVDGIYWMLTNKVKGKYVYIFAEGERPSENTDLIANKLDEDLYVDIKQFRKAMALLNN